MAVDMAGTVDLLQEAIEEETFVEDLIYDDDEPDEDLLAAPTERGTYNSVSDERENRSDGSSADKPKKQRDPISWIASMEGKDVNGRGGSSEKESDRPASDPKLGREKDSRRGGGQVSRSDKEAGAGAGSSKRQAMDSGRTNGAAKSDRLAHDRSGKDLTDKDRKSDRAGRGRHPDADERYGYVREVRPPLRERQQTRVAVPAANYARSKSPRPSRLRATRSRSPDRGRHPTATTSPVIESRLLEKFLAQEGIPFQRWEAFRLSSVSAEKTARRKTGWDQPPPGREADVTLQGARGSDRDRKGSPISPRPAGAPAKGHPLLLATASPSSPKVAAKVDRKETDAKGRSDHERKRSRDPPSSQADQQSAKKPRSAEPPTKAKPAQEPLKNGDARMVKDDGPSKRDKPADEKSARETREERKPDPRALSSSKPVAKSSPTSKDKAGGPSPKEKDSTLKRSEEKDKRPSAVPSKGTSDKGKKGGEELSKQPEKEKEVRPDAHGRDREKERAEPSKGARKDKEKERVEDLEKSRNKDKLAGTGADRLSGIKTSRKEDPGRPAEPEKKVRKRSLFDVPPPVQALPLPPHPATVVAAHVVPLPPPPKLDSSNVPRASQWEPMPSQLPPPPNALRGVDRGGASQRVASKVGHVGVNPPPMKVSSRGNSPNLSRRPSRDGRDVVPSRKSGAGSPPVTMDLQEFWYIDPMGNAMGPHSLNQLRTWLKNLKNRPTYEKEYEEFRHALVWRGRKEDRAKGIALVEMLARHE